MRPDIKSSKVWIRSSTPVTFAPYFSATSAYVLDMVLAVFFPFRSSMEEMAVLSSDVITAVLLYA